MPTWDEIYDKEYAKEYDAFYRNPDWVEVAQNAKEQSIATILEMVMNGDFDKAVLITKAAIRDVSDEHADMLATSEANNRKGGL